MSERTGDTRARIKQVALELFTEQGYEQTSLREIAERLGVTKAALYYHFKSKEEIVSSFVEERVAAMADLAEWVRSQPPSPETRRKFIDRYAHELQSAAFHSLMRFFQENQPALKGTKVGEAMRTQMFALVEVLAGPDAAPIDRMRTAYAVFVLHSSWFLLRDAEITDAERSAAALEIALELVDPPAK
ncbi:MAG TPA: TetR family transcriptional regulator [Mycobacteriales bacterium]|nr:TetR family transcriptional regulator [Mycobacteriales bacterium]